MKRKQFNSESDDYILPRLVDYDGDVTQRWYIIYYVKNVATGKLKRKRYTSINDSDNPQVRWTEAKKVCKELTKLLKEGFIINESEELPEDFIDPKRSSLLQVLDWGIKKKELEVGVLQVKDYKTLRNHVEAFLKERKKEAIPFLKVDADLIQNFFDWFKAKGRAKKTFNNIHTNFHALFEELIKRRVTHVNLCKHQSKLRAEKGGKHIPYSSEQMQMIYDKIIEKDEKQLLLFIQCVYYLFLRPVTELRFLQVQHLRKDTVFVPPNIAKTPDGKHILIPDPLNDLFDEMGIRNFPPHYYIFSGKGCPGEKHVSKLYFYRKHVKILKALNLYGLNYDTYSYKHTGNIALLEAGVNIKHIQEHNRHTTLKTTQRYMENLGVITKVDGLKNFPKFVKSDCK